jgi:hypothetical protein
MLPSGVKGQSARLDGGDDLGGTVTADELRSD